MDMYNDDDQPRKKALVDALGGDDAPGGMPGSIGNPNTGIAGGAIPAMPTPMAPSAAPKSPFSTKLMEGDTGKLADVGHAAKSPKYDFLQLAQQNKYNYDQLPDMLKELQGGPNAQHWQGWTADKDKLKFTGDPSQLGDEWKGVTSVDAIGGFNSGDPSGWRWGADDGGAQAAPGMNAGRPSFAGSTISPMLQGDAQGGINQALSNIDGLSDSSRLQELIKALRGGQ